MIDLIKDSWEYVQLLGARHNVNPLVFGVLYVGSIPPYLFSLGWLIKNLKRHKPVALSILSTLFFFIMPSGYILLFGKDVAWWVYLIVFIMVTYGAYTAYQKVQTRLKESS